MSKSINKVILLGNLGKDPEVRIVGDVKVASFPLATSTGGYKKQDGTEVAEKTYWHEVTCWRSLAEVVEKYVHKGDKLFVEGTITYQQYQDKNGENRYAINIIATDVSLCSGNMQSNKEDRLPSVSTLEAAAPKDNDNGLPF